MLELAREDPIQPYTGKPTAFYDYVRKVRLTRQLKAREVAVRFEGMAAEFLQIDWGELRDFPFSREGWQGQTRYFFAARLKYSRFMFVRFEENMEQETLVRCLVDCFLTIGGVPWVVTTDNMKTVVIGRDEKHQPIWNSVWQKLAVEFDFHPEACWPASGNQKGTVENLVKFVKGNFVSGRTFYDDADLAAQLTDWLYQVNYVRECSATQQIPASLLPQEQPHFGQLPAQAHDYGMFESLVVNREGVVSFETNKYSVPATLVGQTLTARIHREVIRLYAGMQEVASHPRCQDRNQRIVKPEHYEKAFATKPRARVMVYRDWLIGLGPVAEEYLRVICKKQRARMNEQILTLYGLAQSLGVAEFVVALELASEQGAYGAEYVVAVAAKPGTAGAALSLNFRLEGEGVPAQAEVERPLMEYERMVANGVVALGMELPTEPTPIALPGSAVTASKAPGAPTTTARPPQVLAVGGGLRG